MIIFPIFNGHLEGIPYFQTDPYPNLMLENLLLMLKFEGLRAFVLHRHPLQNAVESLTMGHPPKKKLNQILIISTYNDGRTIIHQ
jgi:hypothetical protein